MQANISAKGYTSVILVMNMKRFVSGEEDRRRFETLRGKAEFRDALRSNWPMAVPNQKVFIPISDYKQRLVEKEGKVFSASDKMSTEEIGFASGIFRSLMLEEYTFPTYAVDKSNITFSAALETNFQFKTLFKRAWDRWDIFIRPTATGFFILRLTERYRDKSRSLLALAQDVLRLQESLDIPSAERWLERSREKYADDPKTFAEKEKSVHALLDWVGDGDKQKTSELLYYPIQWKIAMEVASRFVNLVGTQLLVKDAKPIKLTPPNASLSIPLHDSYIIHHFDEIIASPSAIKDSDDKSNAQIRVSLNDIRTSHLLKRALTNLSEGSVLRQVKARENTEEENSKNAITTQALEKISFFPTPRWGLADKILDQNQASWNDELCLLSSRTAIIYPSQEWSEYEMSVSTVPSATLRVKYARYWGAIERMIEFIIEIRVLAQLVESESYGLLGEIAQTVHDTRSLLFNGDIKMDTHLPNLVTRAAYLRYLAALSQSLSHPQLWSRAEYASNKANYLLTQLGVPIILEHIERNITSINSVVDHVDELYLADLSEKSNDMSTLLSMGLASASLILTILILPSFWADMIQTLESSGYTLASMQGFLILMALGTSLAIFLIFMAGLLLRPALKKKKQVIKIINGKD